MGVRYERIPTVAKFVGAIIIVFLLGGAFFMFSGSRDEQDSSENISDVRDFVTDDSNSNPVIIEIKETGFTPSEFTVKKGQAVAWVNSSDRPRWPASDIHPTHELYPEFDSQRPLSPGESWEFVFDRPGRWEFHDHLNPRFKGSVMVLE